MINEDRVLAHILDRPIRTRVFVAGAAGIIVLHTGGNHAQKEMPKMRALDVTGLQPHRRRPGAMGVLALRPH